MKSRHLSWLIFSLFMFSVLAVTAHKMNVFEFELNLLDPNVHSSMYGVSSENIDIYFNAEDGSPEIKCKVLESLPNNFCALTILLSESGDFESLQKGLDLSKYDSIDLDIRYSAPKGSPNIRVSFRNYNSEYVVPGDFTSLKYNTISFEPYFNNVFEGLSLDTLQVERWWKELHNITKPLDNVEIDNISYIEIFPNEVQHNKDYSLWVNRIVLKGQLVSEMTIFSVILSLWFLLVCFLVYRNTQHLNVLASSDVLTGVYNRRGLLAWANKLTSNIGGGHKSISILCIDIDDFKKVNDIYGHHLGDALLSALSTKIQKIVQTYIDSQEKFRLCRLAGDEFLLAIADISSGHTCQLAKELMSATHDAFELNERLVKITLSIGISYSDSATENFQYMIDKAGMATGLAKRLGKNQWCVFNESIEQGIEIKKDISKKLKLAIENKDFYLNFMPIYCADTLKIKKAEVLIRTDSEELKGVGPDVYIPIAEEYNLIHEIDMMVIEKALQTINENNAILNENDTVLCINVSALELHHNRFVEKLNRLLMKYSVDPKLVELEITETTLVDVDRKSVETLREINRLGVDLALDDFGTGYAAFSQLHNYPVDCLKIDKSFIQDLDIHNDVQVKILKTVLNIADIYKLEIVAEGVETVEQLDFLKANSCHFVQGYLLSKPIAWDKFESLLLENKPFNPNYPKN